MTNKILTVVIIALILVFATITVFVTGIEGLPMAAGLVAVYMGGLLMFWRGVKEERRQTMVTLMMITFAFLWATKEWIPKRWAWVGPVVIVAIGLWATFPSGRRSRRSE